MAPRKKENPFGFDLPKSNIFGDSIKRDPFKSKLPSSGLFSSSEQKKRDSRRKFTATQGKEILAKQKNRCAECGEKLDPRDIHYHHKKPWAEGGKTTVSNGKAVCGSCHNKLTHKNTLKKVDKKRKKNLGLFGNF